MPARDHNIEFGFSTPQVSRIRTLGSTGARGPELEEAIDSLLTLWSARYDEEDVTLLRCRLSDQVGPALIALGPDAVLNWVAPFLDSSPDPCQDGGVVLDAWRTYLLLEADSTEAANSAFDRALVDLEHRAIPGPFDFYRLAGLATSLGRHLQAERLYGQLDSSQVWLFYTRNGSLRVGYDWGLISLSYLERARAYESWGEIEKAVRYYNRFLDIWSRAEPDLQHYADEARQGLGRLRGERR